MAAMTQYSQERKYFAEKEAKLFDYVANPRFKTKDLYRTFSTARTELRASGLTMLNLYTSAANEDEIEAGTAIDYVDNPLADEKPFPGRWRLISNTEDKDPSGGTLAAPKVQGITQHLRLYRLTTILDSAETPAIDFTMARLLSYDTSPGNAEVFDGDTTASANPAKLLAIEWAAIHPSKVADVVAEFTARFTSDLTFSVDGQEFTGLSYLFTTVSDEIDQKDGTKKVRFIVGRPEFVLKYQGALLSSKAFTGYILWDIPKDAAQTAIDAVIAGQAQGVSVTPEYNESSHTVSLRLRVRDSLTGDSNAFWGGQSCTQVDEATIYQGYTATALVILLDALAGQVESGVWFDVSGIREDEDGLYDCTVTKHTAVRVEQAAHTTKESAAGKASTERVFSSTEPEAELIDARETGTIVRRAWTKNPNCTTEVARTIDTPEDQNATGKGHSAAADSTEKVNTEMAAADFTTLKDEADEEGVIRQISGAPTEAGNVRVQDRKVTPTDQTATGIAHSAAADSTDKVNTEMATADFTALKDEVDEDGVIRRISGTPTEAGNVRVQDRKVTPANQIETGEGHSSAEDSTEETNTEMSKVDYDALDKDEEDGTRRTIRARPTEAGNVAVTDAKVTPVDQESTSGEESAARSVETVEHTQEETEPAVTGQQDGHIHRLESRQTDVGKFHIRKTDAEVHDQTSTGGGDSSAARTTATTVHTESDSDVDVSGGGSGHIIRGTSVPTEAGKHRTSRSDTTMIDQTDADVVIEDGLNRQVKRTSHTEGDDVPTAEDGNGYMQRAEYGRTESGKVRSTVDTVTPTNREVKDSAADAFKTSLVTTDTQKTDAEADLTANEAGKIKNVRNVPTDTGFRTEKTEVTATERDTGEFISEYGNSSSATVQKYHNAASIVAATDNDGKAETVDGRINDFQKFDYTKTTVTGVKEEWSGEYTDRYGTGYYWKGRNCTAAEVASAIAAASLTDATSNSVTQDPTVFKGLYNYSIIKHPYNLNLWWNDDDGPVTEDVFENTGKEHVDLEWRKDGTEYRTVTSTYLLYYDKTEAEAHARIDKGGMGSKVWSVGQQWKAINVTNINYGEWTADESLEWS